MSDFRVLHVSGGPAQGGAARAALRIHAAVSRYGVDSRFLSTRGPVPGQPETPQEERPGEARSLRRRGLLALSGQTASLQRTPSNPVLRSLNVVGNGLGAWIDQAGVDIVHLHWVGDETLSVAEIGRLRTRVCWTMHDMWPFCGAEHYDDLEHPGRFTGGYDPATRAAGASGPDLDAWTWRRKRRAWAGQRLHLVGPSRWITDCAGASSLLGHQPRRVIPNCVDTDCFTPRPAAQARAAWGLRDDRRYILFGAQTGTSDPRKGFHLLQFALQGLRSDAQFAAGTELVVFGPAGGATSGLPLPVRHVGHVEDTHRLALLYSAVDAFAAPSMQDNLPNTVVEALACGTPCVAFDTGGMGDLVENRSTGWLARPFDAGDLAAGLRFVLASDLRDNCRRAALRRYAMAGVAAQYAALYRDMLERA